MKYAVLSILLVLCAVLAGCSNESHEQPTQITTVFHDETVATTNPTEPSSNPNSSGNVIIRPSPTIETTERLWDFVGQENQGYFGEVPDETTPAPTAATTPTATTPPETTPTATEPPETEPPETEPEETTDKPREYVPQEPDTTEYPKDSIQATLTFFAGMLYVNDNREDALVKELPDGYIYVGVSSGGPSNSIPKHPMVVCHIAENTEFYGSLQEPDYLYYQLDGKYRRMIRAGLVENYWDKAEIEPDVPENYTQLFFESLLTGTFGQNRYHCATYSEFDTPDEVDLNYLFYNGFYSQRQRKITEEESAFLLSDGWDRVGPVSNAKRLPVWLMDADLRRFFGISFYDAKGVGVNQWQSYWSQTGSYYVWRSDSIGSKIKVDEVTYDDGIYTVTYTLEYRGTRVMRLIPVGDTFRILSNKVK